MRQSVLNRPISMLSALMLTICAPTVTQASALTFTTGANSMPQGASAASLAIDFNEGKRQGNYHSQYFIIPSISNWVTTMDYSTAWI